MEWYGWGRLWKGMAGKNVVGVRYGRVWYESVW